MRAVWGVFSFAFLVGRVGGDLGCDIFANSLRDPVGVGEQCAELFIERLEDVAQPIQLRLGLVAGGISCRSAAEPEWQHPVPVAA